MASVLSEERYKQVVEYLRGVKRGTAVYPAGVTANLKRGLRQQAACFEEKDGVLFHCSKDSQTSSKRLCRVVVAEKEKRRLIEACHDGVDGGHYGRDKTFSKV